MSAATAAEQQPEPPAAGTTPPAVIRNARHRPSTLKLCYHLAVSNSPYLLLPLATALALRPIPRHPDPLPSLAAAARSALTSNTPLTLALLALAAALATIYLMRRPRAVYLLDFACYKPGPEHVITRETFMRQSVGAGTFTPENLAFQRKILERSGLGQGTFFPRAVLAWPPRPPCMAEARAEAEAVMFGAVDQVLAKTGVRPCDIGVVVVNCSLFNPTPSLSAMVVNHYKLRGNVASYNLGGMGCSAGLISIDLAKQLLQVHRNTYALVVSMENITLNWYWGNNRSMLMSNCLFRMGGAAVLLTNRGGAARRRAKYQLVHTVRTHQGADDRAYRCVFQEEDESGRVGVALSKDLMAVAGEALRTNITTLGPLVLPLSEQILFLASLVGRRVFGLRALRPYLPDFKMAFEHFCIHAGGRAVLDTVERNLGLSGWHMEPSRMTLHRWGNTSSSSLWYELAYAEAQGRVRRGHRVWQIAFGSGFKCNSAVWQALRDIDPAEEKVGNPWVDEIHRFPVEVPKVESVVTAAAAAAPEPEAAS
ncbi:3-ketoacyl-CoA synthase 20-like [Panicum virgatum]|uniref:3-ketoacyl-CoA synthase n=1 Tax=Panicum virgatum TaxID=38727 RepID=A0A8T0P8J7_PANVG|nr:3-ketoacyl-CoA synthase 20-like [Panicum virgatum]KAG2558491.1 hypothetical protein PVAP13_8NG263600 [Panicum virgatum]